MSLMPRAICMRCGSAKDVPFAYCQTCGFEPRDDADLAKSVYLSLGRFEDAEERSRYAAQLTDASATLRAGTAMQYVPAELERLTEQLRLVRSVPPSAAWGAVGRLFFPALVLLSLLATLVWFLRVR
jgi:hypothetical protein